MDSGWRCPRKSLTEDGATDEQQAAAAMAALWERYKETMVARLAVIEDASRHVLEGALADADRRRAHGEAHKLAGSIGTFGYREASRLAREIEELLVPGGPLGEPEVSHLAELVDRLGREVGSATAQTPRMNAEVRGSTSRKRRASQP